MNTTPSKNNTEIIMCGLSDRARRAFDRCDLTQMIGEDHIYWSVDKALMGDKTSAKQPTSKQKSCHPMPLPDDSFFHCPYEIHSVT